MGQSIWKVANFSHVQFSNVKMQNFGARADEIGRVRVKNADQVTFYLGQS
jgi:hypothetical protein